MRPVDEGRRKRKPKTCSYSAFRRSSSASTAGSAPRCSSRRSRRSAGCAASASACSSGGAASSTSSRSSGFSAAASRSISRVLPAKSGASSSALSCRGSSRIRRARRAAARGSGRPRARPSSSTRRKNGDGGWNTSRYSPGSSPSPSLAPAVVVRRRRRDELAPRRAPRARRRRARRRPCRGRGSRGWSRRRSFAAWRRCSRAISSSSARTRRPSRTTSSPPTTRRSTRCGPPRTSAGDRVVRARRARARRSARPRGRRVCPARASRGRRGRSTSAPPRVPSRSASRAVSASGPPRPRATSSACFTSRKRSLALVRGRAVDAEPDAHARVEHLRDGSDPGAEAQVRGRAVRDARAPPRRSARTSSSERWTQCAHHTSSASQPTCSRYSTGRQPKSSLAVLLLLDRLGEVRVELQPEPARELGRLLHQPPRDGERRAGRDRDLDERPASSCSPASRSVSASTRRDPRRASPEAGRRRDSPRSIEPREATMRTPSSRAAATSASTRPADAAREDVVVVEDGRAARERELGEARPRGRVLRLLVDPRPDGVERLEPREQVGLLRPRARERLVEVMVRVDEAGRHDRAAEVDALLGGGRLPAADRVGRGRPRRAPSRGRARCRRRPSDDDDAVDEEEAHGAEPSFLVVAAMATIVGHAPGWRRSPHRGRRGRWVAPRVPGYRGLLVLTDEEADSRADHPWVTAEDDCGRGRAAGAMRDRVAATVGMQVVAMDVCDVPVLESRSRATRPAGRARTGRRRPGRGR